MPLFRWMCRKWTSTVFLVFATAATSLHAQNLPLPTNRAQKPTIPTVTFTFDWPSVEPHHYVISVDSSGHAAYESSTTEQGQSPDSYTLKLTISSDSRERIFTLAQQLNYFNGDFEFHKHKIASSGDKILAYADAERHFETRFNWSENTAIQELTGLFEGVSTTLEAGRRLERLHRFDRLGLNDELKTLERLASDHAAAELQLIVPILQQVADDFSVMNIARQRARHLLQLAGAAPSSPQ